MPDPIFAIRPAENTAAEIIITHDGKTNIIPLNMDRLMKLQTDACAAFREAYHRELNATQGRGATAEEAEYQAYDQKAICEALLPVIHKPDEDFEVFQARKLGAADKKDRW